MQEGGDRAGNRVPALLLHDSPELEKEEGHERERIHTAGRRHAGKRGVKGGGAGTGRRGDGRRKGEGGKRGEEFMRAYGEALKQQLRAGGASPLLQVRICGASNMLGVSVLFYMDIALDMINKWIQMKCGLSWIFSMLECRDRVMMMMSLD